MIFEYLIKEEVEVPILIVIEVPIDTYVNVSVKLAVRAMRKLINVIILVIGVLML